MIKNDSIFWFWSDSETEVFSTSSSLCLQVTWSNSKEFSKVNLLLSLRRHYCQLLFFLSWWGPFFCEWFKPGKMSPLYDPFALTSPAPKDSSSTFYAVGRHRLKNSSKMDSQRARYAKLPIIFFRLEVWSSFCQPITFWRDL